MILTEKKHTHLFSHQAVCICPQSVVIWRHSTHFVVNVTLSIQWSWLGCIL